MRFNPIGPNQNEIEHGDITLMFSYKTPVAAFIGGQGAFVTDTKFSRTTSKHINQTLKRWGVTAPTTKAQSWFDFIALNPTLRR